MDTHEGRVLCFHDLGTKSDDATFYSWEGSSINLKEGHMDSQVILEVWQRENLTTPKFELGTF